MNFAFEQTNVFFLQKAIQISRFLLDRCKKNIYYNSSKMIRTLKRESIDILKASNRHITIIPNYHFQHRLTFDETNSAKCGTHTVLYLRGMFPALTSRHISVRHCRRNVDTRNLYGVEASRPRDVSKPVV